jgi:hypothetical protein
MSTVAPAITLYSGVTGGAIAQADIQELLVHLGGTKEVSSFKYRLQNWDGKYSVGIGTPIGTGEDGYIEMGRVGAVPRLITTRNEHMKFITNPVEHYIEVSGRDWGEKLFRQQISEIFVSQKGEDIVKHLLDSHSGLGHTRAGAEQVENTDTTFALLDIDTQAVWDVLKQIASDSDDAGVIGFDFRVAPDGIFEFFHRGAKTSAVNLDDLLEDAEVDIDILSIRNKVTIYGAATKSSPADKDETAESLTPASGDWTVLFGTLSVDATKKYGTAASSIKNVAGLNAEAVSVFTFDTPVNTNLYPALILALARDANMKSDGTRIVVYDAWGATASQTLSNVGENEWTPYELAMGVRSENWNLSAAFDWTQVTAVYLYSAVTSVGTSGNIWCGQLYFGKGRYSNTQSNAGSIATYGERQYADICEDLNSDNECMLRAKSILDYKKSSTISVNLRSTVLDYGTTPILPGDTIPLTLPNEGITDVDFRVISAEYHFLALEDNNQLEVSLELGYKKSQIADYVYALRSQVEKLKAYKSPRR